MKDIAIALDSGTPAKRNAITNYFNDRGDPLWHWIDDFWIVRVNEDETPRSLHKALEELGVVKPSTILIFEFKGPISYWGRAKQDAWHWLSDIGKSSKS